MLPEGYTMIYDYETDEAGVWSIKNNQFLKITEPHGGNTYRKIQCCQDKKRMNFQLHRLIAYYFIHNPNNKTFVDHIDGNRLNNKISNLRWVTRSENNHNRLKAKGYYRYNKKQWYSRIRLNGQLINLGIFNTEEEARNAYETASKKYFPGINRFNSI